MTAEQKIFGERWSVIGTLGEGGQGVVYEVKDLEGLGSDEALARALFNGLKEFGREEHYGAPNPGTFKKLIETIRKIGAPAPVAALKELLPVGRAVNAASAAERMKHELEILRAMSHPAMIRILDVDPSSKWFVMEMLPETLTRRLGEFTGKPLKSLIAFRQLVEVVAELHKKGIVHRDIKPDNIFVRADGSLVLGDCGLAIRLDDERRVTDTYEQVGSRDWMPGWAISMRLDEVKPNFDVFSLGKLLWAMVSQRPRLRLWYHDNPEFSLEAAFPDNEDVLQVTKILKRTVVEHPNQCVGDASQMLVLVDDAIAAIQQGARRWSQKRPNFCRACGDGHYAKIDAFNNGGFFDPSDRRFYYRCDHCGHLISFFWKQGNPPPAWRE